MYWFSQSWLPTAIGAWSGPINTALIRVDPSSIPIAVKPSMMAWLVLVPMSLTLPGGLETRLHPHRESRSVVELIDEGAGLLLDLGDGIGSVEALASGEEPAGGFGLHDHLFPICPWSC